MCAVAFASSRCLRKNPGPTARFSAIPESSAESGADGVFIKGPVTFWHKWLEVTPRGICSWVHPILINNESDIVTLQSWLKEWKNKLSGALAIWAVWAMPGHYATNEQAPWSCLGVPSKYSLSDWVGHRCLLTPKLLEMSPTCLLPSLLKTDHA